MNFFLVLFALLTTPVYDGGAIHLRLIDNTEVHGTLIEKDLQGYLVKLDDGGLHHVSFAAVKGTPTTTKRTVANSTSDPQNGPKPLRTFNNWLPKHSTPSTSSRVESKIGRVLPIERGKSYR